ncbi:MAG: GIY-YIG nuclease family protein [Rhodospirillaceae bacterium]|nr:GIY-YIG nuclease family protein [Rhodospirillaceae bacterium]
MRDGGFVYILTNRPRGVLYIGVAADIAGRITAHRSGDGSRFAQRYNLHRLVHVERFDDIEAAIAREKQLKHWNRDWKLRLIEEQNPEWNDLFDNING